MSARDDILGRVRRHAPSAHALPELPPFARGLGTGTFADFAAALERMGGKLAEPPADGSLEAWLAARFPDAGVVCSAVPEALKRFSPPLPFETVSFHRRSITRLRIPCAIWILFLMRPERPG